MSEHQSVAAGAAIVLGFDGRPATRDVDAIWRPHGAVLDEAWAVADELGLPRWWLNEQASSYLPSGHAEGPSVFVGRALRVMTADPELLLAMKVRAARTGDRADIIILLADRMGLSTAAAVLSVAERVFEEPVPPRQRQVIEDLFLR